MKVGFGLFNGESLPEEHLTPRQAYLNEIEQAVLAEEVGLDSVWCTEHHFLPETNHNPDVLGMCAALAVRTNRVQIGTCALLPPLYHPLWLAAQTSFLDNLSDGRFLLGVGLGYRDIEFSGFGRTRKQRAPLTEETLTILRQAWSGEAVEFHGQHYDLSGFRLSPRPRTPGGPKVLIGGYKPVTLDRVARLGDGWLMDAGTDSTRFVEAGGYNRDIFVRVEEMVAALRAALESHGRRYEDVDFVMLIGGFLSAGGADEAWSKMAEGYMHTRRVYGDWYGIAEREYSQWYPSRMSPEQHAARRTEIWLGTPDDMVPRFERLRQIVGERLHILFRCHYPGIPHDQVCESIKLLGEARRSVVDC
jgi:alkanesulfonate monooxygenase SsuD/methylene tetrahydromethanopterin reductase-like flavin-dependent oxidoreductase (luciferase family)